MKWKSFIPKILLLSSQLLSWPPAPVHLNQKDLGLPDTAEDGQNGTN